jgi:hypothetical protein
MSVFGGTQREICPMSECVMGVSGVDYGGLRPRTNQRTPSCK